jgi:hypothetical protein
MPFLKAVFLLAKQYGMKKYIAHILIASFVFGFTVLVPGKIFSQATQQENKIAATDNATTTPGGNSGYVKGITPGRARSLVGIAFGLVSLVVGWRAKVRSAKTGAKIALALGFVGIVLSIVHLSIVAGAVFGSGSGKAGAIVGLLLGLTGMILGGLTLRSKTV